MAIQVTGVVGREVPGIKAAMKEFVKANRENGDAVLNLEDGKRGVLGPEGQPLTENDQRPAYVPQSFPKMLYHPKHGELVVEDKAEMEAALEGGYQTKPTVKVRANVYDPQVEKANLERELKEKEGQINTLGTQFAELQELFRQQQEQIKEMLAAQSAKGKPKAA